jgi:hypothetical protein
VVHGYASIFGAIAVAKNDGGRLIRIAPRAFILPERGQAHWQDIPLLLGHNLDGRLGSTFDGSLRLEQDETGLLFEWVDRRSILTRKSVVHIEQGLFGACVTLAAGFRRSFSVEAGCRIETVHETFIEHVSIGPNAGFCPGTSCSFKA